MKRAIFALAATAALLSLTVTPASADFGLSGIGVTFTEADGTLARQAGSHPFAMTTSFAVNSKEDPEKGVQLIDGAIGTSTSSRSRLHRQRDGVAAL